MLSGTFEQLLTYTGFGVILFSALAVLSLFFVRRTATEAATFRAWGYPWAPALFCLVSFAIVINTIVEAPGVASAGLLRDGGRRADVLVRAVAEREVEADVAERDLPSVDIAVRRATASHSPR